MEVAVVIVTVGETPLLERGVRAIASGTLRPSELIVVDQGQPGLGERLDEWLAAVDIRPIHVPVPRMGVSRARNLGVEAASADALAFTDDDCVPATGWLEALAGARARTGAEAATGRVLALEDPRPGLVGVSLRTGTRPRLFHGSNVCIPWDVGTGGNLLVEQARFRALGGFAEEFGPGARFRAAEDVEFLERMLESGAAIAYTPAATVYHEMKPRAARTKRQFPYGYGVGALARRAPFIRRRSLARRYLAMQARVAASGLRHVSPRRLMESLVAIVGFVAGFAVGGGTRARSG